MPAILPAYKIVPQYDAYFSCRKHGNIYKISLGMDLQSGKRFFARVASCDMLLVKLVLLSSIMRGEGTECKIFYCIYMPATAVCKFFYS